MLSTDYVLIITGCIFPKSNVFSLKLKDAEDRLNQYINSIIYYINDTSAKNIVFCENSGYDYDYSQLEILANKNGKKLEVLVYEGDNETIAERGKGYGEGEILEYAMMHSELIKDVSFIYKVTGRISVMNFDDIVSEEEVGKIYFNNNLYSYRTLDTRFWGMPKDLYKDLFIEQYRKVFDAKLRFLEHVFWETLSCTVLHYYQHPYFPRLDGKSGTSNAAYKETKAVYSKWMSFVARKGLFNQPQFYFCSYVFLHWEKVWWELLVWLRTKIYHYFAEAWVRVKKCYVLSRTVLYHYYAELMVRVKKCYVLSRTVLYHYYAESRIRLHNCKVRVKNRIKKIISNIK